MLLITQLPIYLEQTHVCGTHKNRCLCVCSVSYPEF